MFDRASSLCHVFLELNLDLFFMLLDEHCRMHVQVHRVALCDVPSCLIPVYISSAYNLDEWHQSATRGTSRSDEWFIHLLPLF